MKNSEWVYKLWIVVRRNVLFDMILSVMEIIMGAYGMDVVHNREPELSRVTT